MTTSTALRLLRPDDPRYDEHRLGFQTHLPQCPAAVVVPTGADDIAAAVRLAIAEGRRVAVQATGHGVGAVDPDALLLDVSGLRGVAVDPATRTARVAAGARWGDVITAAAPHGLAPLSGSSPAVGVVGYLLAGGLPLLGRRHGWAAAGVRSVDVVTADGRVQHVPAGDDGLGWAVRGGGGSFAVVTAVTVDLVPLRTVYGGQVVLPADDAPAVLRGWRDWAAGLSDATGTSAAVVSADLDAVPPPLRGHTGIAVRVVHDGSADTGARVAAPLRDLGEPLLADIGVLPWTESARIHRDPAGPAPSVGTTVALTDLPDRVLDAATGTLAGAGVRRVVEVRRLGGALTRPTGLPLRTDVEWSVGTVSITPDPVAAARAAELDAAFRASVGGVGRLPGFLFGEGAHPDAVRSAWTAADWDRLRQVKAAVDPGDRIAAAAPVPAAQPR